MKEYKVNKEEENIRIDKIVNLIEKEVSRSSIQRMIEEGNILVNGNKTRASYKVTKGDTIKINEEIPKEADILPQNMPLDIIYEDDDILIINKEKGIVVHPGAREYRWNTCKCNNGKMQRQFIWNRWKN